MITTTEQMREAAARAAESPDTPMLKANWSTAQDAAAISASMSIAAAIRAIPIAPQPEGASQIVEYTNWRGETARRVIRPVSLWWGKTDWHHEEQWMLTAYDCEKDAMRDFAWQDMRPVPNPATSIAAAPQPVADDFDGLKNKILDMIEANIDTMKLALEAAVKRIAELEAELAACKTQPMAVTVNPLVDRYNVKMELDDNTAMAVMCPCDDGHWVHYFEYAAIAALTIQPADPLSDPRVVALVEALEAFKEFDDLPTQVKRPDLFEIKVRKPILRTLAEIKGESHE